MFDNSGLVKLRRMGVVVYCWIKSATRRKKAPCPKCQKRKVQKMLSLQPSARERLNYELAVQRDRFVRLESLRNDLALDLPHSIPLPDGEEIPYGSSTWLKIRDPQQESEIYQQCIRPPPNRTITKGDSPPPFRHLSSARAKKSGDLFGRTVRCLGLKREEEPAPLPPPPPPLCVYVPIHPRHRSRQMNNRSRQIAAFAEQGSADLSSVPAVSCAVPAQYLATSRPGQVIPESLPGQKIGSQSAEITSGAGAAAAASTSAEHYLDTKGPERSYQRGSSGAVAAAAASTSAEHYVDTKGPERSYQRGTSGAATAAAASTSAEHYLDTKGPDRSCQRGSSAAGSSFFPGEFCDTKGPDRTCDKSSTSSESVAEKKPEKGSV